MTLELKDFNEFFDNYLRELTDEEDQFRYIGKDENYIKTIKRTIDSNHKITGFKIIFDNGQVFGVVTREMLPIE